MKPVTKTSKSTPVARKAPVGNTFWLKTAAAVSALFVLGMPKKRGFRFKASSSGVARAKNQTGRRA